MSDVRLSNGSPTLERTEPRLADHPKPSACRSLFGPVDHDERKRDLKGHLREMEEAATAKWNFDFANHTPLANGKLEWELVDCGDVPSFYYRQRGVCTAGSKTTVDLNGNHSCLLVAVTPGCEDGGRAEGLQAECREQCTGRKRPACHEPSAENKRSHTSSEEVTRPSAEHTPRKSSPKRQT